MSSEGAPQNTFVLAHPADAPPSTVDVKQKCEACGEICATKGDLEIHRIRNCWKVNEFLDSENYDEFVKDREEDEPGDEFDSSPTLQAVEVPRGPQLIPSYVSSLIKFLL